MKFAPRLIVASPDANLPDHLLARGFALIHAHENLPTVEEVFAKARAAALALDISQRPLPSFLPDTLEQDRRLLANKSTEPPKQPAGYAARVAAQLMAAALILHGHDRIRQGPHCIVLSSCVLYGDPDNIASLSLTPKPQAPATIAFAAVQPDSGAAEVFDELAQNPGSPPWQAVAPRLDEMLDHWSIAPRRSAPRPRF